MMSDTRKTRSEWNDWLGFIPLHDHVEWKTNVGYNAAIIEFTSDLIVSTRDRLSGTADTVEEARKLAVERYCAVNDVDLPWRPDFDLPTEEGCMESILECGYVFSEHIGCAGVNLDTPDGDNRFNRIEKCRPSLNLIQVAAQWAIANPLQEQVDEEPNKEPEEKECADCVYSDESSVREPCKSCCETVKRNWQPKEAK